MTRSLLTIALGLLLTGAASAQCQRWYPPYPVVVQPYPLTPAIWGAPAPKPLPPAPPPFVPKRGPAVKEETEPVTPAKKEGAKSDVKDPETPRLPKMKIPLPGDPIDKPLPKETPKTDAPKKDPLADKSIEQFIIPADGKSAANAEVKVGFFNHSDREIVLDVNGEPVKLPSEQYVTLRLPRTFNWAEKGSKAVSVVVPPDADGIEIVFRK